MEDFNGNKLNIGDEVVFIESNYREFRVGIILKFTPKKVVIGYKDTDPKYLNINYEIVEDENGEITRVINNEAIIESLRFPKDLILNKKEI